MDIDRARHIRRQILDRVAADGTFVAGSHISFPGAGWVETAGEGFAFAPMRYTHDV